MPSSPFATYDRFRTYDWNYHHPPVPVDVNIAPFPGTWQYCGLQVDSPLGIPAGPLLNSQWCLYYASLGFDVLTYKTVRSVARSCYGLPNLQPVECDALRGGEANLAARETMQGSWAVSYGMPSQPPDEWRRDVARTRHDLPPGKLLSVSVVGTVQEGWTLDQLADDYAQCGEWAVESGADCVEMNFSCPNVATCDGQLYQQPDAARLVAERVRARIGSTPLIAKVGRVTEQNALAQLLQILAPIIDAVAMTNSIATTVCAADGQLLFDGQARGICGAATLDASVDQTRAARQLVERDNLPLELVGVGGVSGSGDVQRYLDAGAHAVQIATAAMVNPAVGLEIRQAFASSQK